MLVSIVCSYYNRGEYIIESINSLLNQTYKNIEIIIIDDGSTDDSYSIFNSFDDHRLRVIRQSNQGFVKAIRKAIELSSGELISIHGAGDIAYPTAIEEQIEMIINNPDVGVVGCHYELKDLVRDKIKVRRTTINPSDDIKELFQKRNPMTHGGVLFKKDVYEQVGGYREFFKYAQDRDLWLRMSLVTQFQIVPKVLQTRLVLQDGVNNDINKRIIQTHLSKIAIQCQKMRLDNREDIVDKYGQYAFCFAEKSKKTAFSLFKLSLRSFIDGEMDNALYTIKLSINECKSIYNISFEILLKFAKRNELLRKCTLKVVKSAIKYLKIS